MDEFHSENKMLLYHLINDFLLHFLNTYCQNNITYYYCLLFENVSNNKFYCNSLKIRFFPGESNLDTI